MSLREFQAWWRSHTDKIALMVWNTALLTTLQPCLMLILYYFHVDWLMFCTEHVVFLSVDPMSWFETCPLLMSFFSETLPITCLGLKLCPSSRIKYHGLEGFHLLLNFYCINSVTHWKVTLWCIQVEYWNVHDVCTHKCVHAYTFEG